MNADLGSWLFGMSLGASALGGMLGMASAIFIVLAATTFGAALLYAISGFGFAVIAAPLFLLFLDPPRAIQLVIIISTVLSIVVLRGLLPAIAPWLLLRLAKRKVPFARAMELSYGTNFDCYNLGSAFRWWRLLGSKTRILVEIL
jgi:hypothetical protein